MEIHFKDRKLMALCQNYNKLEKAYGKKRAGKVLERLGDLYSADCLEDVRPLPGHHHELGGDRKGQWACDLDQPYRLVYEPFEKPIPVGRGGGYDWTKIKIIAMVEITNYHGK